MAIVLTSVANNSWGGSAATGSFTPTNNSLLIGIFFTADNTAAASLSGGSLTWTSRATTSVSSPNTSYINIFTAPVGTGASMTVTPSQSGGVGADSSLVIYQVTGQNASPIGATGTSTITTNALSYSLSGSPASTSYVISAYVNWCAGAATTPTAGSGWTLDNANEYINFVWGPIEYRTGSTSATVSWTDTAPGTTNNTIAAAALEIVASGGGSAYVSGQSALSFMGMA